MTLSLITVNTTPSTVIGIVVTSLSTNVDHCPLLSIYSHYAHVITTPELQVEALENVYQELDTPRAPERPLLSPPQSLRRGNSRRYVVSSYPTCGPEHGPKPAPEFGGLPHVLLEHHPVANPDSRRQGYLTRRADHNHIPRRYPQRPPTYFT